MLSLFPIPLQVFGSRQKISSLYFPDITNSAGVISPHAFEFDFTCPFLKMGYSFCLAIIIRKENLKTLMDIKSKLGFLDLICSSINTSPL
jgi:hypothetical protein